MIVIIDIKVIPNSREVKFDLDSLDRLVCYLTSIPEKGKANKELVKSLSKKLGIGQSYIEIFKGLASRYKKIKIESSLSKKEIFVKLGFDLQSSFIE